MLISELIAALTEAQAKFGDIPVNVYANAGIPHESGRTSTTYRAKAVQVFRERRPVPVAVISAFPRP